MRRALLLRVLRVLQAPIADVDHDGKATRQEALFGGSSSRSRVRSPPPPAPHFPPKISWRHGYWDTWEETFDESVLVLVAVACLYQALVWCKQKLQRVLGKGGAYDPVSRGAPVAEELPSVAEGCSGSGGGGSSGGGADGADGGGADGVELVASAEAPAAEQP